MMWTDGRARRQERRLARRKRREQWRRAFAVLPVRLDDPRSMTIWWEWYERKRFVNTWCLYWKRAAGSNFEAGR